MTPTPEPLLPCPHCGAPGEIVTLPSAADRFPFATKAKCTDCHHAVVGQTIEACEALSAKSWNRRASLPAIPDPAMERARELAEEIIKTDGAMTYLGARAAALLAALSPAGKGNDQ